MQRRTFLSITTGAAMASCRGPQGVHDAGEVPPRVRVGTPVEEPTTTSSDLFFGIDCHTYPGDRAMAALRSKKRITCLYLTHAPGAVDISWIRKLNFLTNTSWGFFPTYLGSQIAAPSAAAGVQHAKEAAKLMKQAGFQSGSIVYLDIETPKDETAFGPYLQTWMKVIRGEGWYPGVYGSYLMVPWLRKYTSAIWTVELPMSKQRLLSDLESRPRFRSLEPEGLAAPGPGDVFTPEQILQFLSRYRAYDPKKHPYGTIRQGCIATQYLWYQRIPGLPLDPGIVNVFDFSSSLTADPSDQAAVAKALGVSTLM